MAYNSLLREERPDFKAYNNGFASLNNVELLSIIIGQGNDQSAALQQARQLLNMCGGSFTTLPTAEPKNMRWCRA